MTKKKLSETDALNFKKTGKSIQYMYYSFNKYLSTQDLLIVGQKRFAYTCNDKAYIDTDSFTI